MINEKELIQIIETALEIPKGTIKNDSDEWHSLWDSLGHLSILVKLDKALHGKCSSINDLSTATSVEKIKNVLKSNNLYAD